MTHLCASKSTIVGSDNGLSSGRPQAIILINGGIQLIGTYGTNVREILIEIHTFSCEENAFENYICKNSGHFVSASLCKWAATQHWLK